MLHKMLVFALGCALGTAAGAQELPAELSLSDRAFADAAVSFGTEQVALGTIAVARSVSSDLQQYGRAMVRDHGNVNNELDAMLENLRVTAPAAMTGTTLARVDQFRAMSTEEFERAYRPAMVTANRQAVSLFQREAASGDAPGMKGFAARTLPMLERHLDMAREMIDGRRISSAGDLDLDR